MKNAREGVRVRQCRPAEVAHLGSKFYEEGSLPGSFDPDMFCYYWEMLMTRGAGVVFAADNGKGVAGTIGATLSPDPSNGDLVAQEAFWFVDPAHRGTRAGLSLLEALESWAEEVGARRLVMAHRNDDERSSRVLRRFYGRRGYSPQETFYSKDLDR